MNDIKSITTVNTSNGWAVCQTNSDGTQLYVMAEVYETLYSRERAQLAAEDLKHHLEGGGKTYAKPLPTGVRVVSQPAN